MGVKKTNNVGIVKFWAWQSRGLSGAVNFIALSYVSLYCTDALGLSPAIVGTLLMASKAIDAFTDLLAGYIVDKTNTKLGKGRPYEFAIVGAWFFTWLMYLVPDNLSDIFKMLWVLSMYILVNAVCTTFLSASQNPYMIRAFATQEQRIKVASFGGIVIMLGSIIANIAFPILINRVATTPSGWGHIMLMVSIPMAIMGMMRFFFVKETENVSDIVEKVKFKNVVTLLKTNPYIYIVAFMQFGYALVSGMGIISYYYKYVVGNLEIMSLVSIIPIIMLPIMMFFPLIMKKIPMGRMVFIGCIFMILSGILYFIAGANILVLIVGSALAGIGVLPVTYLTDLMMIDCGSYNAWKMHPRMDGTIGSVKGFSNKLGGAVGSGIMGILLNMSGYIGTAENQTESAIFAIKVLFGLVPVIIYGLIAVSLVFYKLDKLMPEIDDFMRKNE